MEIENVRFYAKWKDGPADTLYEVASELQALAGLFTAAATHKDLDDLHSVYLHMESAHRANTGLFPTVNQMSKQSPLQLLLDLPTAWQAAGALPVFVLLVELAIGKGFNLIEQYYRLKKLRLEVERLSIEKAKSEAEAARKRLSVDPATFRYGDISFRLNRIEYIGFVDWNRFPYV